MIDDHSLNHPASQVLIVLNPKAGNYDPETVRALIGRYFSDRNWSCEIFETTDRRADTTEAVRRARPRNLSLVVVAGGDGTISSVADSLLHSDIPLGIIPAGTGNILAQELGIPLDLETACKLLVDDHQITNIDVMQIEQQACVSHLSIGIYSLIAQDTEIAAKRRYGRLAYLWAIFKRLVGYQSWRFTVIVDEERSRRFRASLILVANAGSVGIPPLQWGPEIQPNDGHLDVCIIRAKTLIDYLGVMGYALLRRHQYNRNIKYLKAASRITIEANRSLPVRADGEIIGEKSVRVRVIPNGIRVIVPA